MRYTAVLAGEERVVEVTPREGGYRVAVGDRVLEVDAVHLQGAAVSLIVGTRSYRCDIEPGKDGQLNVRVNESTVSLEMLDERKLRLRRASGKFTLEGPQRIDAPMPGKVVRVLVKVGDEVQEGQGLVVVEAMKMENELRAGRDGIVAEIHVREGASVDAGALLFEIR
jgi:biotin carboxyl carrier protein